MAMIKTFYFGFDLVNPRREQSQLFRQTDERVGCNELRFEIRQRPDAVILPFIAVGALVADERDEEAEL